MDKQAVFDKVTQHLLTQNRRSLKQFSRASGEQSELCAYKNDAGDRCAIGCLLEDGPLLNFQGDLWRLASEHPEIGPILGLSPKDEHGEYFQRDRDLDFLTTLQRVHDGHQPKEWAKQLRYLASDNGLSTVVLDSFSQPVSNSQ